MLIAPMPLCEFTVATLPFVRCLQAPRVVSALRRMGLEVWMATGDSKWVGLVQRAHIAVSCVLDREEVPGRALRWQAFVNPWRPHSSILTVRSVRDTVHCIVHVRSATTCA